MAGKNKNSRTTLSGFLRYRGQKMSDSERNAFEKELQKDPFAEEAAEGFSALSAEDVREDMTALQKQLKSITIRKQRLIYYRIAASVAVLVLVSSVFIIIKMNKPEKLISENVKAENQFEIPESSPLSEPKLKEDKKIALNELQGAGQKIKDEPVSEAKNDISRVKAIEKMETVAAGNKEDEMKRIPVKKEAEMRPIVAAQPEALANPAYAKVKSAGPVTIKGKVISSEDNLPIPGASITVKGTTLGTLTDSGGNFILSIPEAANRSLIANFIGMESKEFTAREDLPVQISLSPSVLALNEVVVIGYGSKKSAKNGVTGAVSTIRPVNFNQTIYTPPQAVDGKENFDRYIEDNIRRPSDTKPGQRAVVVISFTVKSTGILDSIRIIRSPGKSFSDEAVRLIKEGPAWKPAEESNMKIDDEVRIRIVFK